MTEIDFVAAVGREGQALVRAASRAPHAVVACYPTWTALDLVAHTGAVHRWVTEIVDRGLDEPPTRGTYAERDPHRLFAWFGRGLTNLVKTLARIDPTRDVWTMAHDRSAAFWRRRMAHETAAHRWDAEDAVGTADPIEALLAVTGIPETLEIHLARPLAGAAVGGNGERIRLRCTDVEGDWIVSLMSNAVEVEQGRGAADITLSGTASSLWLTVMGRTGPAVEVYGDGRALDAFRRVAALVPPPPA